MLSLVSVSAYAQQDYESTKERENQILGAIAGGYLGSTIGDGDGRTAATVLGAILGFRHGPQILDPNHHYDKRREYKRPLRYRQADIFKICDYQNPYPRDSRGYWSYHRGCVQRMSENIRAMEQRAYEEGLYGY